MNVMTFLFVALTPIVAILFLAASLRAFVPAGTARAGSLRGFEPAGVCA